MKPLPLRTSLTIVYTSILVVLMTGLAITTHSLFVRQLDEAATTSLEEKARGLHGYLQFKGGMPVLVYKGDDLDAVGFIDDATDYYQVFDARDGRLLTQSPGLEALGLHYTPSEVAELRAKAGTHDVQTDRGRLRLLSSVITPTPDEVYLVQVGELLTSVDATLAGFDRLLLWRILGGLALAVVAGRWLAGRALVPLSRLALATQGIGIKNLNARLPVRGADDELDQVAQAFNHALARVEFSVEEMRQFSAALAHELRTPVAILRGEAELALRPTASGEDLRQVLVRQIDEFDRLTRLHQSDPHIGQSRGWRDQDGRSVGQSGGPWCIGCRGDRTSCRRAGHYADVRSGGRRDGQGGCRMAGASAPDSARQRD